MKCFVAIIAFTLAICLASKPEDWQEVRPAYPEETVSVWVGLNQRNVDIFQAKVLDISDPSSPNYGQWMNRQQVLDIIAPLPQEHEAVKTWLSSVALESIEDLGDAFQVRAPVSSLEQLFDCKFYMFRHKPSRHTAIRQKGGATIPDHVADYIDIVTGLTGFPIIQKKHIRFLDEFEAAGTYDYVVPSTIRSLYNIPAGEAATNPKNIQAVVEFLPVTAPRFTDVAEFCKEANEVYTNYSKIVGPFTQGGADTESVLDVEYLITMGSKAKNEYWTIADGWAYEMALQLFNAADPPIVVSVSYGWPEVNTCQSSVTHAKCTNGDAAEYVARANTELSKVAGIGLSVLVATQDEGAPSDANIACRNTSHPVFAIYPSSSPWVTAVSATTVGPETTSALVDAVAADPPLCSTNFPCAKSKTERPCSVNNTKYQWTTGGGFSAYGELPEYQKEAVAAWMKSSALKPPSGKYPAANRGYSDLSGVGSRVLIWINGRAFPEAGTSASTPIVAGIITLLNDHRLNAGKKQLGFLNPMLYKMQAANAATFNDITIGTNQCSRGTYCCPAGYGCSAGWDPPTGLGTPNYPEMLKYVMSLA